jgi:hypothetical protein
VKTTSKNKKLPRIIAAILISAVAGGLTKNLLFPSDNIGSYVNHAKSQPSNSQTQNTNSPYLIDKIKQLCPDCENQVQILNKIIKEHPEAIASFKKHFDKLTKEDFQSLIKNFDIKIDMDSANTNSSNTKENGQGNLTKYTNMIKNNISNINFSDMKDQFKGLSNF